MNIDIKNIINEHILTANNLLDNIDLIEEICSLSLKTIQQGNTILLCGNGGSAADSQHIAAEFIGRFNLERESLPAISLTTDTSIITSIGNDYSFDEIFSRQCESLVLHGDIVIGISTSGNSQNVINALKKSDKSKDEIKLEKKKKKSDLKKINK
mgnify:CR=1 FL=1